MTATRNTPTDLTANTGACASTRPTVRELAQSSARVFATVEDAAPEHDLVNHPSHYTSSPAACSSCGTGIECIDVTRHMNFNRGTATKYLWRAGAKGGPEQEIEDLRKVVWYAQDEIARLGGEA